MKTALSFLFLCVLIIACSDSGVDFKSAKSISLSDSIIKQRWQIIAAIKDSVREGDLVLRCGNDLTSASLCDFNQQEKLFSHSGVAFLHEGVMYIYSNMAGALNPDEIMRRDKLDSFLAPANNVALGIYRYAITKEELEKFKTIVLTHYVNHLQFDMNFDLATDDKMYCAEMIAKSLERATNNRITIPKSMVNDELRKKYLKMALQKKVIPSVENSNHRQYWSIDNLYLNPFCREVTKIIFSKPPTPIKFPGDELNNKN